MKRSVYFPVAIALLLFLSAPVVQAQKSVTHDNSKVNLIEDISGTYVGSRQQFDKQHRSFINEFEYIVEIQQKGNVVLGTSYIKNENGDYANIKLRGLILGNKVHFEEYEIIDQQKPEYKVWCLKVGELSISKENNIAILEGETNSFMAEYFIPCSGGFTRLERIDDYNSEPEVTKKVTTPSDDQIKEFLNKPENTFITVYPNPYAQTTTISYNLKEKSIVQLSVYDLNGKLITTIVDDVQNPAEYNHQFNGTEFEITAGVLIVELKINNELYSKQIVQIKE